MAATIDSTSKNYLGQDLVVANLDPKPTLWRLFYRRGDNPGHMFKEFYHPGDLGKVINRCKEHCTTMNYRFISVKPAIVDLAEEEKEHTNSY